jgi:alanyl-tRNA synthetase
MSWTPISLLPEMTPPPTRLRYLDDDALSGVAEVVEVSDGERKVIRLRETWFHPQGGGQKADRGTIGPAQVLHVARNDDYVDHQVDDLAGIAVGAELPFAVDADWRRLNAAYHTAGHLIGSLVETQGELIAVAGHQWPGEARVEFEGEAADLEALKRRLEEDLEQAIARAVPVRTVHAEGGRAIQIGDWPAIPCGGTHLVSLAGLGPVRIDAVRRKGPRTRVSYSLDAAAPV